MKTQFTILNGTSVSIMLFVLSFGCNSSKESIAGEKNETTPVIQSKIAAKSNSICTLEDGETKLISLDLHEIEIQNALNIISENSGINFMLEKGIKDKLTVKLYDATCEEALDKFLELTHLSKVREENSIRVFR